MHIQEMYARAVHAREMYAREMHAREMHAREMHIQEMHAWEMHAWEMRPMQVQPWVIHASTTSKTANSRRILTQPSRIHYGQYGLCYKCKDSEAEKSITRLPETRCGTAPLSLNAQAWKQCDSDRGPPRQRPESAAY